MSLEYQKNLFGEESSPKISSSHIIRVAFDAGVDSCFDYAVPDEIWPIGLGQRVLVPFGRSNKKTLGFCVACDPEKTQSKKTKKIRYKYVIEIEDDKALLDEKQLALAKWISEYYVSPLGQVISAMVPSAVKKGKGLKVEKLAYLAFKPENLEENLALLRKGSKQRLIVQNLADAGAFSKESSIEISMVAQQASTSNSVIKKLVQKEFVLYETKTTFKSMPVIPEGLSLKTKKVVLNSDQINALEFVSDELVSERFGVSLLHGVTDSGKTEVYIRAIEKAISLGKSAIILLPEIALTAQTIQRFSSRFKHIAVMHSGLTAAQRNVQWQKIASSQADVIIGARSAIFAPVKNLGLIVIDEEHEPSYKQDSNPRYHGRDVAIKRAHLENAHCMLGSATPSLETLLNCKTKKHFKLLSLPNRVMDLPMPKMECVDLNYQKGGLFDSLISDKLAEYIRKSVEKREQVILLLNRRGYSNFVMCPKCKHILQCRNCDVKLTFHRSFKSKNVANSPMANKFNLSGHALCHYCNSQTLVSNNCPLCNTKMIMVGLGAQRLEEQIQKKFPNYSMARIDSDSMQAKDYYKVLDDFSKGKIDILAGTQMLAKGLHFPNVTLVGVISADTSLSIPDFRANERTFQLLSQVAGRTGRGDKPGRVVIQTMMPEQPAIKFALEHDFEGFAKAELDLREKCHLPPFARMAIIHLRDEKYDRLEAAANALDYLIGDIIKANSLNIMTRGPMDSTIARLHRNYRMQIIINASDAKDIQMLFRVLRNSKPIKPSVATVYDIDPVNLL